MDLSSLYTVDKAEEGVEFTLLHPYTDEPTDMTVKVYGVTSKKVKNAFNRYDKVVSNPKKNDKEKERASTDLMKACIISWDNVYFNDELVTDVEFLLDSFPWFSKQVLDFITDEQNFLPPKEKSSTKKSKEK